MARPSKLSPELQEKVAGLIRAGNTVEIAAEASGISEATFYAWMARGERSGKADAPYRAFRDAVEQAKAGGEAMLVTRIAKAAADGSWSAAAWLLERRSPERWTTNKTAPKTPPAGPTVDDVEAAIYGDGHSNVTPIRKRTPPAKS
jgi:transposase